MTSEEHVPVLFEEVIAALAIDPNGIYIDCTFGRGGHSQGVLEALGPGGRLLALDRDRSAVASRTATTLSRDGRFEIEQSDFAALETATRRRGWIGRVAGIVMDLGVSSPQLDEAERGFSFMKEGALDMRMNTDSGPTAAQWLAEVPEKRLASVLKSFGEERFARRIARAIVARRAIVPIETTRQLAELIEQSTPVRKEGRHPATRTFQAIRIAINQELDQLQQGLSQAVAVLKPGGRLAVISFHSLEDRIVKRFFRDEARGERLPRRLPVTADAFRPRLKLVGRAQRPTASEIAHNVRARSAILRTAERLG